MSNRSQSSQLSDSKRPTLFDRLGLARISSGIGALGLVVGVLSLLLQHDVTPLTVASMLIGVAGIVLWTMLAPNDFRNLISGRRAFYGGNSIFTSVLMIGIVAIVYTLTANSGVFADMTSVHYYSLHVSALRVVQSLNEPIQITAFYNRTKLDQQAVDTPILRMFADAAPKLIKVVFIDPDENPLLARTFGMVGSFGIYVSFLNAQGQPDPQQTTQMQGAFAREAWIGEAIAQLQAHGKYKVLFTIGDGEVGTDIQKQEDAYAVRAGLEHVGILTDTIDLNSAAIPTGTTAIVLLGPQADLTQPEVDKLSQYMANGGRLLLMAKPAYVGGIRFMTTPDSPMMKYLWDTWGLRPQNDIVFELDPQAYLTNPYRLLVARVLPHKITNRDDAGTTQVRPLLQIAESWEVNRTPPTDVTVTPLFVTSDKAIGKVNLRDVATNLDNQDNPKPAPGDLKGPLLLMASAENQTTKGRLIVIGDWQWVYNDAITLFDGQYLWTNMIDWLTQYLSNITVNPVVEQLPLTVDQQSLNVVTVITLVIMPGLVLLLGGFVWWSRLRR